LKAEEIANRIEIYHRVTNNSYKIGLNTNESVVGYFVQANDYEELKAKNIWRVVKIPNILKWKATSNPEHSELLNGDLIVSISVV